MTASQMAALPTPLTDAVYFPYGRTATAMRKPDVVESVEFAASLEQRLAVAVLALEEVTSVVSYELRMRDAERHPEIGAALVNARTTLALLRAK